MPRFRLRYKATDLELTPGEFVIGRSSQCSLALDDALVSRRHVSLRIDEMGIVVADLGSRNGIAVNGKKVDGTQRLRHLDRLQVGSQELLILEQPKNDSSATLQLQACWSCGELNESTSKNCRRCKIDLNKMSATLAGGERPTMEFEREAPADEMTAVGSSFHLLKTIADKALAMKRYDEAERILGPSLKRVHGEAMRGNTVQDNTLADATRFAIGLMAGPNGHEWLRWLFEIYGALRVVLSRETIEALHPAVRGMHESPPSRHLADYLRILRKGKHTAPERFRIKQLEGLLRVMQA